MSDSLKNTFRSFNHTVDRAMELLTPPEYKCLSFATRHILGWTEKAESRRGYISLSMFEKGFIDASGRRYGGTGLSKPTIVQVTDSLDHYRLLLKIGGKNQKGQLYELSEEDAVNWSALEERAASDSHAQAKRTTKARSTRGKNAEQVVNGTDHPVVSPINHLNEGEVVSLTDQQWLVGLTTGGKSDIPNQKHFKDTIKSNKDIAATAAPDADSSASKPSPSQNTSLPAESPAEDHPNATGDLPDGYTRAADGTLWVRGDLVPDDEPATAYPCTAHDINALIGAWWDWVPKRPSKRGGILPSRQHFANTTNRDYAENLVKHGVTPGDFIECLGEIRVVKDHPRANLRDQEMTFCYAAAVVEEWAAADRAENIYTVDCPRIVPRRPGVTINLGELAGLAPHELYARFAEHPDLLLELPPPYIGPHDLQSEDDIDAGGWDHEWTTDELEAELPL